MRYFAILLVGFFIAATIPASLPVQAGAPCNPNIRTC